MAMNGLPEGWVEGFDSNYGRPYYFHKPTRRASWTKPDIQSDPDTSDGSPNASSFRRSQFSNSLLSSVGSPSISVVGRGQQQQAVSRFNEWLEVYSPEYNRTFFFNKMTRESTWVDPRGQPADNAAVSHKATMVRTEETPAAFMSIWESVGVDAKKQMQQPKDRPQITPIVNDAKRMPEASRLEKSMVVGAPESPIKPTSQPRVQATFDESATVPLASVVSSKRPQAANPFADELDMYARDLERQSNIVNKHAEAFDPYTRAEAKQLNSDTNELAETAEAVLRADNKDKAKTRRSMKRLLSDESALSAWGTEPPKVLDVKRAMSDVKSGMKYVKEELKAQGAANAEAEKVDAEGGYYKVLGVPTNADLDMMKKAYRRAMIKCHPDKVATEEKAKAMEMSNHLQNAYNCLSDPWERYLYDYFGLKRYLQNAKVIQCFKNYLLSGIMLIKHPRKGYPRPRMFWISPDFEWLLTGKERILEPTPEEREEMKGVRIRDIHEITRGITTEVFERTGKPKKQSRYFSIITNDRTLDLEAESKERADFLVSRISLLVLDVQKNKKWLHRHFELKALREAADMSKNAQQGYHPKPPSENPPPDGSGDAGNPASARPNTTPEPNI